MDADPGRLVGDLGRAMLGDRIKKKLCSLLGELLDLLPAFVHLFCLLLIVL
jgi:hypothetical protein